MPELGLYGSVRGAAGNSRPYREHRKLEPPRLLVTKANMGPQLKSAGPFGPALDLCCQVANYTFTAFAAAGSRWVKKLKL